VNAERAFDRLSTSNATAHPIRYTTQTAELPHRVHRQPGFEWDAQNAYLFDIDGTLLRSRDRIHYNAFAESVRHVMGHDLSLDGVTLQGNTDPGILRDAFLLTTLEDGHWRGALEEILKHMRENVAARRGEMNLIRMPAIEETLRYLHSRGAELGVATGNLESIGWLKIETIGLREWFTFGGFSDRYMVRAEMIAHAAELARKRAGAQATVCVVGDTVSDIRAAKANGLPTIAVATGQQSFDVLMELEPEVCASSLEALMETAPAAAPFLRGRP
jgi:phosphoglycolate phosphatase-like HAD superfamily hydrolase